MPEGPEVRREARALAAALVGVPIECIDYRVPRLAGRARRLRGARVAGVTSRGKAMLIAYDVGLTDFSHHQLYGSWHVVPRPRAATWLVAHAPSVRVRVATPRHAAMLLSATAIELLDARALRAAGADFATLRFAAYGREGDGCYGCGGPIRRTDAAGRDVYFCPRCQPA